MRPRATLVVTLVATACFAIPAGTSASAGIPDPIPCDGCWQPAPDAPWQIQFSGELDLSIEVEMFEVDMFDTSKETVEEIREQAAAVCYVSAGSWERWRPDAGDFPESVLGKKLAGWPGERWLDTRKRRVLKPIMTARIERCADKGFDGIEFDNVDGHKNRTGFDIGGRDQLRYNTWLANEAHRHDLAVALKNDPTQVDKLVDYFDWALVEQCFQYDECGKYSPFIDAGKPVLVIEYELKRSQFCSRAEKLGFNAMRKRLSLNAWRKPCS